MVFYHNIGEGGLSGYHPLSGNVVWNIGMNYFSFKTKDGKYVFDEFEN